MSNNQSNADLYESSKGAENVYSSNVYGGASTETNTNTLTYRRFQVKENIISLRKQESLSQANIKLQKIRHVSEFEKLVDLKKESGNEKIAMSDHDKKNQMKNMFKL